MRTPSLLLALAFLVACDADPTAPELERQAEASVARGLQAVSVAVQDPLALDLVAGLTEQTLAKLPDQGQGVAFAEWVRLDLSIDDSDSDAATDQVLLDALALIAEGERDPVVHQ